MIHNVFKVNRTLLANVFYQSERWFTSQHTQLLSITSRYSKERIVQQGRSACLVLPTLASYNVKRQYSIGEYDKLWQAVSSGRGKGRGGKKKVRPKDVHGEFLKFGSANMTFPGLNAPLLERDANKERKTYQKKADDERQPFKVSPAERGWSGTTWPGRHAGAPQALNGEVVKDFDSIVIEVKKVSSTKASGKRKQTSAIVVVGNKKGSIGWAIGKASFASGAIRKARNKAVNYLHYVPICDGHTIYHNLRTKVKSTEIKFERKVPGYGRRCQRIVRAIAELAGIEDIRCKLIGRTTPLTVVRCAFQGFEMQETHQELAERLGKNVVEYRPEQGNRPIIVASPSQHAIKRRVEQEKACKEEDITAAFDPHRGAHRPKSLTDIRGTHPDLLVDVTAHLAAR